METYTKEQLIDAMTVYNEQYLADPKSFGKIEDMAPRECAENQVEKLLQFIK